MDLEGKVDEMRGMLHEMKPVIAASARSLESLDSRQRRMEIKHAEMDVRVGRVITDLDNLGRKVRGYSDRHKLQAAAGHDSGRWLSFLEVLAAAPKYWHVFFTLGSFILTAVVILVRHWPK